MENKTTITIADVLAYRPCDSYTFERLAQIFAGRDVMSLSDVLATDIPARHKLECILRTGLIPKSVQDLLKQRDLGRIGDRLDRNGDCDPVDAARAKRVRRKDSSAHEVSCAAVRGDIDMDLPGAERDAIKEREAESRIAFILEQLNG